MRCKGCGIQLTANNMDNCPNCGTPEDQGRGDRLPRGLFGVFFSLTNLVVACLIFASVLGILFYLATGSSTIGIVVFLVILGFGGLGFLGLLDSGG